MSCVLSIIVSHVVLERRHEKRSGKEMVLLTSLALGGRTWHTGPPSAEYHYISEGGGVRSWGIERDLEGNLCCQISWSFHGQRQTI